MDNLKEILPGRLREAFGKDTQETVARKLVTQQGTVSKWISGTVIPPTDVLLLIAEAYKVSVDWLLGISDEKEIDGVVLERLDDLLLDNNLFISKIDNYVKKLTKEGLVSMLENS